MSNEWQNPPRHPSERDMSGLLLSEAHTGFPGHLGGIRLIEQSTDRRLFLCADLDRSLTIWTGGAVVNKIVLRSDGTKARAMDRVHAVAFSEDASLIFVAAGLHLRCLDAHDGREVWSYRPANVFGFLQTSPRALVVSKNKSVFMSSDSGEMCVFRASGEMCARWRSSDAPLFADLHKEGSLIIGSDGATLTVWDIDDRRRLMRYDCSGRIYGLKVVPRTDKVVLRTDRGIAVFDLYLGRVVRSFHVLPGLPFIDASAYGQRLLTGEGGCCAVYSLDGERVGAASAPSGRVISARFDRQGSSIHIGSSHGGLSVHSAL